MTGDAVRYEVGRPPAVAALGDLRESVGWGRCEEDYPAAFAGYATCVTAHDEHGQLLGWCAVISDGVRHGFLVDVMVTPARQREGIGRALVTKAVGALAERGVTIVHVDFAPQHAGFYARCGFRPSAAGIMEFHAGDERRRTR